MANEKRLIDLDKIKPMDFPSCEMDGLDVVRYLNTLPTVDAVEVVRRKDCKWSRTNANDHEDVYYCELRTGRAYHSGDFCSYGERREGE